MTANFDGKPVEAKPEPVQEPKAEPVVQNEPVPKPAAQPAAVPGTVLNDEPDADSYDLESFKDDIDIDAMA